jgi:hypothetical protein
MDNDEEYDKDKDPRFDFILQYLIYTYKIKMDAWFQLKSNERYKVISIE